jgi:hypothetical protein
MHRFPASAEKGGTRTPRKLVRQVGIYTPISFIARVCGCLRVRVRTRGGVLAGRRRLSMPSLQTVQRKQQPAEGKWHWPKRAILLWFVTAHLTILNQSFHHDTNS